MKTVPICCLMVCCAVFLVSTCSLEKTSGCLAVKCFTVITTLLLYFPVSYMVLNWHELQLFLFCVIWSIVNTKILASTVWIYFCIWLQHSTVAVATWMNLQGLSLNSYFRIDFLLSAWCWDPKISHSDCIPAYTSGLDGEVQKHIQ